MAQKQRSGCPDKSNKSSCHFSHRKTLCVVETGHAKMIGINRWFVAIESTVLYALHRLYWDKVDAHHLALLSLLLC